MKTIYACTRISKEVCVDDFENGCELKRTCVMDEVCNIRAPSMPELIEKLGEAYGLKKIDNVFLPNGLGPDVAWFGFNRLEDSEGNEPSPMVEGLWKKGRRKLWLADYSFSVEKRVVSDLTAEDFKGIEGVTVDG